MLSHVVSMKFRPEVTKTDIDELDRMLEELPNIIVEIQMYEFGRDVLHTGRSYDYALVALFANEEALQRYQKHPDHLKVLEKLTALCENVITVDFFGTDAGDFKDRSQLASLP
ncbi:MAG: Dabb family protein [Desulfobacterales bacterium]